MEMKTQLETLVSLYNDQLELVLNRKAGIRMMQKMNPSRVLTREMDPQTMLPKETTVADRLKTFGEALELDQGRLDEYANMMVEEKNPPALELKKTGVETS